MRDNINVNSSLRLFESYRDFSGGLNTQQSNDMMKDNQVVIAENIDLALTRSIKKRTGRTAFATNHPWLDTSPIQGMFKFVNNAETVLIVAVEGKIYYARPSGTGYGSFSQISIDSGTFTFQITDCVEAVQYNDWLYIATGTKLCRVQVYLNSLGNVVTNGETISNNYKPTTQEALYVGLNSLNTNPSAFLTDLTTASTISIEALGIYIDNRRPAINTAINFTAYRKTNNNAPTDTDTEYEWYYKKSDATTWTTAVSYGVANANKTYALTFSEPGSYDVRVKMRLANHHAINDEYVVYGLTVYSTVQPTTLLSTNIQKCRKILLHWDRLILYDPKPADNVGTSNQQDCVFISDLANPLYFPEFNVISFAGDTQQQVRKIVRYRNILLIFTPDTVQSLAGKSPSDYVRSLINNQVGALWANSVQVVENDVYFVSKQGIYAIRPNTYTQDNFNIASLDTFIKTEFATDFITTDSLAASALADRQVVSAVFDNQYYLYSTNGKIYRHYYDRRAWVIDDMSHLGTIYFSTPIIASFNGEQTLIEPVFIQPLYPSVSLYPSATLYPNANSAIMVLDSSVYTDMGFAYTMALRTKYFDLSEAFNWKKLRKIYILARLENEDVALAVTVQADSPIILDPEVGTVTVDPNTHAVTWTSTTVPNFNFYAGTYPLSNWTLNTNPLGEASIAVLKTNLRAKCKRVRVTFQHFDGSPCEIYGFGLEFRSKAP